MKVQSELKQEHELEYAALSAEQKQLLEHWLQPEAVSAPDVTESGETVLEPAEECSPASHSRQEPPAVEYLPAAQE